MIYYLETIVDFGKHEGKTILQIFSGDKKSLEDNIIEIAREYSPGEPLEKLDDININHGWHKQIGGKDSAEHFLSNGRKLRLKYEGSPGYLAYCIRDIPSFVISPNAIEKLETSEVINLKNIEVIHDKEQEGYIKIKNVEFNSSFYKFSEEIKKINESKYKLIESNNNYPNEDNNDRSFSEEKYDGYNGWDDDTIDEAFEGDPENTWNID